MMRLLAFINVVCRTRRETKWKSRSRRRKGNDGPTEVHVVDAQFAEENLEENTGREEDRRETPITEKFFPWNRIRNDESDETKIWKFRSEFFQHQIRSPIDRRNGQRRRGRETEKIKVFANRSSQWRTCWANRATKIRAASVDWDENLSRSARSNSNVERTIGATFRFEIFEKILHEFVGRTNDNVGSSAGRAGRLWSQSNRHESSRNVGSLSQLSRFNAFPRFSQRLHTLNDKIKEKRYKLQKILLTNEGSIVCVHFLTQ